MEEAIEKGDARSIRPTATYRFTGRVRTGGRDEATSGLDKRNFVAKEFNEIRFSVARFESLYSSTCLSQTLLARITGSLSNSLAQSSSLSSFFTSKKKHLNIFHVLLICLWTSSELLIARCLECGSTCLAADHIERHLYLSPPKMLWFPWRCHTIDEIWMSHNILPDSIKIFKLQSNAVASKM